MFEAEKEESYEFERVWYQSEDYHTDFFKWVSEITGKEWEEAVQRYLRRLGFDVVDNPYIFEEEMDALARKQFRPVPVGLKEDSILSEVIESTDDILYLPPLRLLVECKDVPVRGVSSSEVHTAHSLSAGWGAIPIIACPYYRFLSEKAQYVISTCDIPVITGGDVYNTRPIHEWMSADHIQRWWHVLIRTSSGIDTTFASDGEIIETLAKVMVGECDNEVYREIYVD